MQIIMCTPDTTACELSSGHRMPRAHQMVEVTRLFELLLHDKVRLSFWSERCDHVLGMVVEERSSFGPAL